MNPKPPSGYSCKLKKPKATRRDRGLYLAVCISSLCEGRRKIVSVTDRLLMFGRQSGVDGVIEKSIFLHPNWFALYSADDMTDIMPILDRATILMCGMQGDAGKQKFLVEAGDIFTRCFAMRHQQLIESRVMIPSGFKDLDDFDARGKDSLPADEHRSMRRRMRAAKPECAFLVGGFNPFGLAHLFVQDSTGPWQGYDDPGWWTIGSGATEAFAALLFQADKMGFGIECTEAECVYHLLSAKFMAESNRLVGPKTFVSCHEFNQEVRYMPEIYIDRVRKEWERCGIPRMPKALLRKIPRMLETEEQRIKREHWLYKLERKMFSRRPSDE